MKLKKHIGHGDILFYSKSMDELNIFDIRENISLWLNQGNLFSFYFSICSQLFEYQMEHYCCNTLVLGQAKTTVEILCGIMLWRKIQSLREHRKNHLYTLSEVSFCIPQIWQKVCTNLMNFNRKLFHGQSIYKVRDTAYYNANLLKCK